MDLFNLKGFDTELEWSVINNGHTVKVTPKSLSMMVSGGGLPASFTVAQIHFHWSSDKKKYGNGGSEHVLNSIRFWGELHVVMTNDNYQDGHLNQPDGLAVLGFFIDVGVSSVHYVLICSI